MRHGPDKVIRCTLCGNPWGVIRPSSPEVGEQLLIDALGMDEERSEGEWVYEPIDPPSPTRAIYVTQGTVDFLEIVEGEATLDADTYYEESDWADAGLPMWMTPHSFPAIRWDCCGIRHRPPPPPLPLTEVLRDEG